MTIMNDETLLMLKGHGLEDCVVYKHTDEYEYAIEVEFDGYIDEVIKCNGMFGYEIMAEKIFDHVARAVDRGDAECIRVVVRDTNRGILWTNRRG